MVFLPTTKLFGNVPRNFYLVLTIWSEFIIFIKLISLPLSVICLWKTIITSFKGICVELNIYQPISFYIKTMKKQQYFMHVVLSSLPMTLDLVKSQLLVSKDLPSLSEVFDRLRHATLFDCSTATLPSCDKSAFVTSMGSGRGGHAGRGVGVEAVEVVSKGRRLW